MPSCRTISLREALLTFVRWFKTRVLVSPGRRPVFQSAHRDPPKTIVGDTKLNTKLDPGNAKRLAYGRAGGAMEYGTCSGRGRGTAFNLQQEGFRPLWCAQRVRGSRISEIMGNLSNPNPSGRALVACSASQVRSHAHSTGDPCAAPRTVRTRGVSRGNNGGPCERGWDDWYLAASRRLGWLC